MTDQEFEQRVKTQLATAGATEILFVIDDGLIGVSCTYRGEKFEMNTERGPHEDQMKEMMVDATARFGGEQDSRRSESAPA